MLAFSATTAAQGVRNSVALFVYCGAIAAHAAFVPPFLALTFCFSYRCCCCPPVQQEQHQRLQTNWKEKKKQCWSECRILLDTDFCCPPPLPPPPPLPMHKYSSNANAGG
jgi:hypothetical protein